MGGNSASHLSHEDGGGGGVTFVKGIRLSDRVISRMRQSSQVTSPQPSQNGGPPPHSPETQTPTPLPASSVDHTLITPPPSPAAPEAPPSVEPAPPPTKLVPPSPVKFRSLPPTTAPAPPPAETKTPPPPTPPAKADVEPASPSLPPASLEPVVQHPPTPIEPGSPSTPPVAEQAVEPLVPSPPMQLSPAAVAPSEPLASSSPSEPVKAAEAPATELLQTAAPIRPPVEGVQPPPAVEPAVPPPAVLPAQAEEPSPPAVDSPPPSEPVSSPPPPREPLAAPSSSPELVFEESCPTCRCVDLAVISADSPSSETLIEAPAPSPSEIGSAPEESTPIPSLPPVVEDVLAISSVPSPIKALPVSPEELEEDLRQKIKDEMQRSLEEEISERRQALHQQLEEMRAEARAEASAAARAQAVEQVKKMLEAERAAFMESLTDSIMKERVKTEDETLQVQLYWMELKAHQLEEKEKEIKKRDAFYKEQVAKLEARCNEFYRVTAESYQKGKEETHSRFARFTVRPLCADLQSQILKCYRENTGKTLSCSGIASAYMQCVDKAKKNKLTTGG